MSSVSEPASLLESALGYARLGLAVFPVNADKRPRTPRGFHDATTDEAQIREWWMRWPDAGIGLPTGARNRIVVVDVDDAEALEAFERAYGRLTATEEAVTPSGGRHLYYKHPGDGVTVKTCAAFRGYVGLDVRGDGGYVVAPPTPGYRWELGCEDRADLPAALLEASPHRATSAGDQGERIRQGTRNATLTSLAGTMRRRGMTSNEILAALEAVNSARCDPPLEEREVRGVAASIARYAPEEEPSPSASASLEGAATAGNDRPPDGPVVVPLADLEPRTVEWVWQSRIPLGKLMLVVGDPGLGKSFVLLDAAARVSTGTPWPDGTTCDRGSVVLLTAEDGLADTVVPRLIAMGADRSRVQALTAIREAGRERPFSLARDLPRLEEVIERAERSGRPVRLVGIDPVSAYIGQDTDSHVDADVRAVLAPLAQLADRRRLAVSGVLHLNKGTAKAIYRVIGSVGFVGQARAAFVVTPDPADGDGPRRLFAPLKMNLTLRPPTLAFAIDGSRVAWEPEPVYGVSVEDALRAPNTGPHEDRSALEAAEDFLRDELAEGPQFVRDLQGATRGAGIAWRTVERAKARLRVVARRDGFGDPWVWALPGHGRIDRQDHQFSNDGGNGGLRRDVAVYADPMLRAAIDAGLVRLEDVSRRRVDP